ncbi:MAG TPA: SUKH-3 domain-containing protein [Streptosporangiaceae bacterium]
MRTRFGELTTRCLLKAGWHPGRNAFLPEEIEAGLRADGHVLLPSARAFLAEFSGLTIIHPHARTHTSDRLVISALLAAEGRDAGWVREYERRSGESALTPVGEAARGYLIMCMGADGHVYGGYDDFLLRLGISGDDAIEGLCTGREAPRSANQI